MYIESGQDDIELAKQLRSHASHLETLAISEEDQYAERGMLSASSMMQKGARRIQGIADRKIRLSDDVLKDPLALRLIELLSPTGISAIDLKRQHVFNAAESMTISQGEALAYIRLAAAGLLDVDAETVRISDEGKAFEFSRRLDKLSS